MLRLRLLLCRLRFIIRSRSDLAAASVNIGAFQPTELGGQHVSIFCLVCLIYVALLQASGLDENVSILEHLDSNFFRFKCRIDCQVFQLTVRFMETEVTFVAGLRNIFVSGALREMRSFHFGP